MFGVILDQGVYYVTIHNKLSDSYSPIPRCNTHSKLTKCLNEDSNTGICVHVVDLLDIIRLLCVSIHF